MEQFLVASPIFTLLCVCMGAAECISVESRAVTTTRVDELKKQKFFAMKKFLYARVFL